MQGLDYSVDALGLRLYGELAVASVKGIDDLAVSIKDLG